ncbi:MAG TPA: 16S rRNA (adenine(1518)-N(6)/adenine(1519)-N(6))-dimethyltransferase, partial [Rhodospirillaceae bacterium]|nr:16S rRNA (adenine(1518)-N(6)/adenine(1519)-N(6))-dimethyltransferase [Rhodospirillaceae bacterium]
MAEGSPFADLPPLRDVIATHGLRAAKSLGQHFLLDLNLTDRIARNAGDISQGTVIEIGPGPGGLTRSLLGAGARQVIAIERDRRCVDALDGLVDVADGRLEIIEADALQVDLTTLGKAPRFIIANLPYNIATALLIRWLGAADAFQKMNLMFQREVADRITALPGSKNYGRLSVLCNWRCETRLSFGIPARAFTPPPQVASAIVSLTPYKTLPEMADQSDLEAVTAAAFGQRRKMLRSALKQLDLDIAALLADAAIEPTRRAEELSIAEFARLARSFKSLRKA